MDTITEYGKKINTNLSLVGVDYSVFEDKGGLTYQSKDLSLSELPYPNLVGEKQIENLGGALRAIELMSKSFNVTKDDVGSGIVNTNLKGRMEIFSLNPLILLDVAHNEESAIALYDFASKKKNNGKVLAVFSILADKSIESVISPFINLVDEWYISTIDHPRALSAEEIKVIINKQKENAKICIFSNLQMIDIAEIMRAAQNDNIIVFGSFFTVAQVNLRE